MGITRDKSTYSSWGAPSCTTYCSKFLSLMFLAPRHIDLGLMTANRDSILDRFWSGSFGKKSRNGPWVFCVAGPSPCGFGGFENGWRNEGDKL